MAGPIATPRSASHIRSNSLPSRSHPSTARVEERLCRLKASEEATSTASSSSSICHKLSDLRDLYDSVDDMLQLPLTQQALSHDRCDKCVEDLVLDGSLRLLDMCGTTKDILSRMKDCVQGLESSLRRRRCGENGLANEVRNYMILRKNINKMVCECLKNLKRVEKKQSSVLNRDSNLMAVVQVLREVEEISLSVFESLLSCISQPKARSKTGSWSLVSKLMRSKRIACKGEDGDDNELEKINVALNCLNSQKTSKLVDVEQVQTLLKPLEALELSIQEFEDGLETVFRCLVKTRVSLLNILS